MTTIEIETISLLVRLYEHKIDSDNYPDIIHWIKDYYPNQDTDNIDHYIKMCLIDLKLEDLIKYSSL